MNEFDFTTIIDRTQTGSWKYKAFAPDVLPVWIADMDFAGPPCIQEALRAAVDHGVFGYTKPRPQLIELVRDRLASRHDWSVAAKSLVFLPGLVTALNLATALLKPSAEVLIPTPAYPPFHHCAPNQGRKTVAVDMTHGERWELDFDALEAAITPKTGMLILCNPQNPTGRAYTLAELQRIAAFVEKHDLLLVSDEIHCDLILDPAAKHISIAAAIPEIAGRTITLLAASKTFNIAGLGCSFAVIENATLRKRFEPNHDGLVPHVNQLGYVATEAAYRDGEPWRVALIDQLRINRGRVMDCVAGLDGVSMIEPEATYLAWIDCRELGIDDPAKHFVRNKLAPGFGSFYGDNQSIRINFATPPATLDEILRRFTAGVNAAY